MNKLRINIKLLFQDLLIAYPVVNILWCVAFKGDNMMLLSCTYCLLLIGLYIFRFKKINKKTFEILVLLLLVLPLEIERDLQMISLYVSFIMANIMLCLYSTDNISINEYLEAFKIKRKFSNMVQVTFCIILSLYVLKYGFRAGWNTFVLQGPYNYAHTLAYLFFFMLMIDAYYYIEDKAITSSILIAINLVGVFLTAVRSALLASIVIIIYILYKMLTKKQFMKVISYLVLLVIMTFIAYKCGFFNALLAKTKLAVNHGSISNGRGEILSSSLNALSQGSMFINTTVGIGMTNLIKWNGVNINAPIHAHNDFGDALVCYGMLALCVYIYNLLKFSRKKVIWIAGTLGLLAYSNGLFVYSDVIPMLIYSRILFSNSKQRID